MHAGASNWNDVINNPRLNVRPSEKPALLTALNLLGSFGNSHARPTTNKALLERLLELCPCLYTQIPVRVSPRGVIHLCEIALGSRIVSSNVWEAFQIQHPNILGKSYLVNPLLTGAAVGDIMEAMCSEVLSNEGLPELENALGWPIWDKLGHICLNKGKMRDVKAFGDILIPCAPSNIVISVKTESAKERLLYSSNMIEGVGFGFFKDASEFWTVSRMNLFKRMGFTVIYLPKVTLINLFRKIIDKKVKAHAYNVNGTLLYRSLDRFGSDMRKVAGKTSLRL